jgi:hypothetical protein
MASYTNQEYGIVRDDQGLLRRFGQIFSAFCR